jgi:PKD repeat protein
MKKANQRAGTFSRLFPVFVVLAFPVAALAGAPILSGVNPTLTPSIPKGSANPPGYTVSSFLNPIVTDGTLLDDFEGNTATTKWGGTWFTVNDNPAGGLSTIVPPYLTFTPSAPGYNSAYCGKINVTLQGSANLGYNPYAMLTVNLNPASLPPPNAPVALDLTKATGFRYWFKGGKHYFKVETTDIVPGIASYYQDSVPASPTWKLVYFPWDSLHSVTYASGLVSPVKASSKVLATRLSWVFQGPDGTVDSLFIDSVSITGFSDRGIAVTGANNANGAWQYSTNAGTSWTPFGALSDQSATLLNAASQVRFVPNATYSGPSTFIFRAWNQIDNKANGSTAQIVVPNGGVTAYSSLSATGTVQVQSTTSPAITTPPQAADTVNEGGTLTLSVVATNATAYQWRKGGAAIAGATAAVFTKNNAVAEDAATYTVMVKNATDSVLSSEAIVTVRLKPANATVTPAFDTLLVGGSVTFTVNTPVGTAPFTFQWLHNGVVVPNQNAKTYAIASAVISDSGGYSATVTNAAGATTSSRAYLVVNTPIKALFKMSDSIIKIPTTIQFTDQSTGGAQITKRLWDFGDGKVDTSNATAPAHQYDSSGVFTVKLVVMKGAVRQDSMIQYVKAHKDNPIIITGRFLSTGKAEITFSNYGSQLISTGVIPPNADSMMLWYKSGSVPTSAIGATMSREFGIAAMQAAPIPFKDTASVVLAGTDAVVGFMTQVHWNNGTTWYWSPFDQGNGTLVIMSDTATPQNPATISGTWIEMTDFATFTVFGLGPTSVDTASVDSFFVWWGTSITDTVPNFNDISNTKRFRLRDRYSAILANNGHDTVTVGNPQFNTGVQKKLWCAVMLMGKNHKPSGYFKAPFYVGRNRPQNPILLSAKAIAPSQIQLSWRPIGGGISNIRFWYNTAKIPVGQADFTSPPYDSVSVPSVMDTQLTVSNLHDNTTYHFGGQVYSNGQWSFVTDSASASATTPLASGKLAVNSVKITNCIFDTSDNSIHVSWKVNNALPDTLQIGISYSIAGGFPVNDTSVHQIVPVTAATGSAIIKLREPVVFSPSPTDTTWYYIALWESRVNGTLTDPTDSSRVKTASPTFNKQAVVYFTKVPGDTNSVFNGNLLIITDSVLTPGDVNPTHGVVHYYTGITPNNLYGFIPVSIPFNFTQWQYSRKFIVQLKLTGVPPAYAAYPVRIYQFRNGLWYVDRNSSADNVYARTKTQDTAYGYPLMALIDTIPPTLARGSHTDTLLPGTNVYDTIMLKDNCANLSWRYYYTRGGDDFSRGGQDSGVLAAQNDTVPIIIPGMHVAADNGLRARVVINDGAYTLTSNVSRQVRRDSSDFIRTIENTWVPLRVTAFLDSGGIKSAFQRGTPGETWAYDKKKMRLFRWYPSEENLSSDSKWVEYSDATSDAFAMTPGTLVWQKGLTSVPVNFGTGVTPTLRSSYPIQLSPDSNWTDFALPFRFKVRIGDIIDSTGPQADSLQIYSWVMDMTSKRFVSNPIYIKAFASLGIADKGVALGYEDLTGYTALNPLTVPVILKIPPITSAMSAYGVAKRTVGNGWALSVVSTLADGSGLSPVYCGYSQARETATSYFPVPPSFGKEYVGVYDGLKNKVYGHALVHVMDDGGCTYMLAFVNSGTQETAISFRITNLSSLPKGLVARTYNATTGASDDFTSGTATVTVPAGGKEFRVLAVGTPAFLAKAALVLKTAKLAFAGIYPNPASSLVRIRYSVPGVGVNSVKFCIYDLRGRMVWQKVIDEHGNMGAREVAWDGRSLDRRPVSAGAYIIRMTAFDGNDKMNGVFEKKLTYLP